MTEIQEKLFALRDEKYRDFNASLIPTVDKAAVIGVRVPQLRRLAKELKNGPLAAEFMADLPHEYHDENLLQALLINENKDFWLCMEELEAFLPYVDNWAVCDMLGPKVLAKDKEKLLEHIPRWLDSPHAYTQRFAAHEPFPGGGLPGGIPGAGGRCEVRGVLCAHDAGLVFRHRPGKAV